jgi:hypothetical protein
VDILNVNQGALQRPAKREEEADLEVVVDPDVQVGEMPLAPGCKLLRIRHPRHGWLSFLMPQADAASVAQALGQ